MTSPEVQGTASLDAALAHASALLASEPALAAEQAREILRVVAGEPRAELLLGCALRERGDLDGSLETLRGLARRHAPWALAHYELGRTLGRMGRGAHAIAALRRALELKPSLPGAWLALGDHLSATGDRAGADHAYAQHIRHSVRDPALVAAAAALVANRLAEAETRLREHLKRAPTDVAAIRMLAEVAARLGRYEDAEVLLARCVELAPGFHEARQHYAQVLHRANKPAEALAEVEKLLAVDASNPSYRNLKAVLLCRTGDYAPAIELYDGILAQYPDQSTIWLSYGHALKTAGRTADSIDAYRRSIALDAGFGEAYWSLANLKTFKFSNDDVAAMRAQLERDDLAAEQRLQLEFALGKALEDRRDYERSFAHYARGNALRVERTPYDARTTTERFARAKALYTRDFFASRADWGAPDADPIFIVGLPRSGSTLIEQILASHSMVEGTMELPEITSITRELKLRADAGGERTYHDAVATLTADEARAFGESYLERTRIQRKSAAPRFIDKMPNNFAHIGLIHLAMPNARIVDARRHPMACCFSGFKQHFARGQNFSYRLSDLGAYYRDYVGLMAHFDRELPGRVHRVIYESMVEDTEAQVRALLDYCGLPFEPQCLRFFENDRPVRTASSEQVRQPIYKEGVDHWRNYEPWLSELRDSLGDVLETYPEVPKGVF